MDRAGNGKRRRGSSNEYARTGESSSTPAADLRQQHRQWRPRNLRGFSASVESDPIVAEPPSAKPARNLDQNQRRAKKVAAKELRLMPPTEPKPTRDGQRSLTRALGLKIGRIVIDPGHGGHDTGTIGPHGLMEKDVCLDVALRLGRLIEQKLPSAEVSTRVRTTPSFRSKSERPLRTRPMPISSSRSTPIRAMIRRRAASKPTI